LTDQGDWYTMQMLKSDIQRLRRLDAGTHRYEIEHNTEALDYLKQKVLIK
jgi:hypothetical protein